MKDVTVTVENGTARVDPHTGEAQQEVAKKLTEAAKSPRDLSTYTGGSRTGFLVPESVAKAAGLISASQKSAQKGS